MSHYEFFALCFLAKHPGWVFSKQQIYEAVWNDPDGDGNAAVTNLISQIRKKLNP
ncbi:MAG: helix-turn-helix domain-containing protein [Oscillospiraceae bacterium]|nr:helix-turn-helix domain-containing protein [Oscillospiraceae bacterium]